MFAYGTRDQKTQRNRLTDEESVFISQVISEVAPLLGITLKHANTKHAQTKGVLERTHASLEPSLKTASGEYQKQWQKNLSLAILNYNTSYHTSLSCKPIKIFHSRIPYNILGH